MNNLNSLFLFTIICLLNSTLLAQWVTVFNDDFNRPDGEIGVPWILSADTLFIQNNAVVGLSNQYGRMEYNCDDSTQNFALNVEFDFKNDSDGGRFQFFIIGNSIAYIAKISKNYMELWGVPEILLKNKVISLSQNTIYKLKFQSTSNDSLVTLIIFNNFGSIVDSINHVETPGLYNSVILGIDNDDQSQKLFDNVIIEEFLGTGIEITDSRKNILDYKLFENYPNPFNPLTTIKFSIPRSLKVKIEVFNMLGQKIETLLNKHMTAGSHEIEFMPTGLPSGVYLYRIETGKYHQAKKMILIQ